MKIDFISGSLSGGGAERVLAILANYFTDNGHVVRIITFNKGDAYDLDHRVKRIKLHHGKIKNHKIRSLKNLFGLYKKKNNRPNVIISFITHMNLISIIVARLYNIKIIASEHNSHLRIQHPKYLTYITRTILYPMTNYLTVLTSFDIQYYKNKRIKVVVMPNPCSFNSLNKLNTNRKKIILAIGNLDRYHHKGFDNLIELIAPILKSKEDWILKIVGGGEKGLLHLNQLTREYNLSNQVFFTGFRNDVQLLMQESEIFVLPSRFEGLPMVLLEAMSQGLACIAYDCKTGPSDIIEHKKNGLLIEDQNMKAMQYGLTELINDHEYRDELRNKAIQSLNRFSIDNVGAQWEQLFQQMELPN